MDPTVLRNELASCRATGTVVVKEELSMGAESVATRIVDGHELSYAYKARRQFVAARERMKAGVLPIVADPTAYGRVVSAGFGLWMDDDWRRARSIFRSGESGLPASSAVWAWPQKQRRARLEEDAFRAQSSHLPSYPGSPLTHGRVEDSRQ